MISVVTGLVGVLVGAGLTVLTYEWRKRRFSLDEPLSDDDREALTQQFTQHANAMRRQVGIYADTLAGGDSVLRERLRHFERGGER